MDTSIAQDPLAKLEIAKQKKETGDQAFKTGEIRDGQSRKRLVWQRRATRLSDTLYSTQIALRSYHEVRPFYTPRSLAIAH